MRRPLNSIVTLAFVAITCSLYVPMAHGQGFFDNLLDLANEVDDLINNNSNNNSSNSNNNSSNSSSRPAAAGTIMVPANSGWTSDPMSANTTIDVLGKRWSLPVAFDVDANGNVTVMP